MFTPDLDLKDYCDHFHITQEEDEEIADLSNRISKFVNRYGNDASRALADKMARNDHRTLVQAKFGLFLEFAKVLAEDHKEDRFDLRNQFACETAVKIMEITNGVAWVPLI